MPKVRFLNELVTIEVPADTVLRDVALQQEVEIYRGLWTHLNCTGLGICGRCKVWVAAKGASSPSMRERFRRIKGNMRLACQVRVLGDVDIRTRPIGPAVVELMDGEEPSVEASYKEAAARKLEEAKAEAKKKAEALAAKKKKAAEAKAKKEAEAKAAKEAEEQAVKEAEEAPEEKAPEEKAPEEKPKPEVKPEPKPPEEKPKPEVKPEPKPEAKPEPKPEAKPAAKPEPKPEAKPAAKPEPKPAPKPAPSAPQPHPGASEGGEDRRAAAKPSPHAVTKPMFKTAPPTGEHKPIAKPPAPLGKVALKKAPQEEP